jgi:hypothetical protein
MFRREKNNLFLIQIDEFSHIQCFKITEEIKVTYKVKSCLYIKLDEVYLQSTVEYVLKSQSQNLQPEVVAYARRSH